MVGIGEEVALACLEKFKVYGFRISGKFRV